VVLGALAAAGLAGLASVVARPVAAATATTATAPTTAPETVVQVPEFLALAALARQAKHFAIQGTTTVAGGDEAAPVKGSFEVWAKPPVMKLVVKHSSGDRTEWRVSDGKSVYCYVKGPGSQQVWARDLTPENFYPALELQAIFQDATGGYASLTPTVRFVPVTVEGKLKEQYGKLKWFELQCATKPRHPLLLGTKLVRAGIDPSDGLVRVLIGTQVWESDKEKDKTREVTVTLTCDQLKHEDVQAAELLLPADAADIAWVKLGAGDKKEPMPTPTEFIQKK
jgi:hypothetical protein